MYGAPDYDNSALNENADIRGIVSRYVRSDESLLWSGKPCKKGKSSSKGVMTAMGVFFLAFSMFWTAMATTMGGFFGLFGVPFICVALFLVFGQSVTESNIRKNTYYAVTDRRVFIVYLGKTEEIREYLYKNINSIAYSAYDDKTGTLRFITSYAVSDGFPPMGTYPSVRYNGVTQPAAGVNVKNNFVDIPDAYKVYEMINVFIDGKV